MAGAEAQGSAEQVSRTQRFFEWVGRRIRVITIVVAVLSVLMVGVATARSTEEPEFAPRGEIYDTFDLVSDNRFESSLPVAGAVFIVEGRDGADVLTAAALLEWKQNSDRVRVEDGSPDGQGDRADLGHRSHLVRQFDPDIGAEIDGIYSIANAVDEHLPRGLTAATTGVEVKLALHEMLAEGTPTTGLRFLLSEGATAQPATIAGEDVIVWQSPAFISRLVYDFESFEINNPDDDDLVDNERALEAEKWLREVQDTVQGDEVNFTALGVAIDPELTSEEAVGASAPFILLAVVLIVLLMGALLRNYWAAAIVVTFLAISMYWYAATLTVIGFKGGLLLGFIVPISVIAFGVDYFVHASGRAREEQVLGASRERAYPLGLTAIMAALSLAVISSIAAFLSNAASGVEAIIEFGIGAAIALAWAYVFLGLLAPKLLLATETALGSPPADRGFLRVGHRLGFFVMVLVGGAVVTFSVVLPVMGAILLIVFLALFVWLPFVVTRRSYARSAAKGNPVTDEVRGAGHGFKAAGSIVHFMARWRVVTVPVTIVLALLGAVAFTAVDSEFSFSDFFAEDSDVIRSVDKLETHFGASTGGSGFIYVEGDLASPDALAAIEDAIIDIDEADAATAEPFLARDFENQPVLDDNAVSIARVAVASDSAREAIEAETGVTITDGGDGLPGDAAQGAAIYQYALVNGVPGDDGVLVFRAGRVEEILDPVDDGYATLIKIDLTTLFEDAIILDARDALDDAAAAIEEGPAGDRFVVVAVSGETIIFQDSLAQFTTAMLISLPIALVLCALIATIFMRSWKYALTAVVPILLVVGWVYGFMWLADYKINVVTATIAAIAVGVGIDFATHFTMRFREEFEYEPSRFPALRRAGEGTGGALTISAASSILGFLAMSLAPMPIFQTFGVLTAVMIFFSLFVSLLVLPSLLLLVTPSRVGPEREALEEAVTHGEWEYRPHARATAQPGAPVDS